MRQYLCHHSDYSGRHYYFSDANLAKDHYIGLIMDEVGWVDLTDINRFNKMQEFSLDVIIAVSLLHRTLPVTISL